MSRIINGKRWDTREVNITKEQADEEVRNMKKYGMEVKKVSLASGKYSVWIHNPAWAEPGWKPRKNISPKKSTSSRRK